MASPAPHHPTPGRQDGAATVGRTGLWGRARQHVGGQVTLTLLLLNNSKMHAVILQPSVHFVMSLVPVPHLKAVAGEVTEKKSDLQGMLPAWLGLCSPISLHVIGGPGILHRI